MGRFVRSIFLIIIGIRAGFGGVVRLARVFGLVGGLDFLLGCRLSGLNLGSTRFCTFL